MKSALIFDLPATFELGDVAVIRIAGEQRWITWVDAHTLLFVPGEKIVHIERQFVSGSLRTFVCKEKT